MAGLTRQPTQSGTFMGGLVSGFQTGEQIRRNRQDEERAKREMEMREEEFEASQETTELQQEASELEIENARDLRRREKALRQIKAAEQAYEGGSKEMAADQLREGLNAIDMDPSDISADYARSLEDLSRSMKNPGSVGRDQALEAANRVFRGELQKGIGEQTQMEDGRRVTIKGKEIENVAPAPKQDTEGNQPSPGIIARLRVTGETDDDEQVSWRAPLTVGRSSDPDDPATTIPMDEIAKHIAGRKQIVSGMARDPRFRDMIRTAKVRAGGEVEEPEYGMESVTHDGQEITYLTEDGLPLQQFAASEKQRDQRWHEAEDGSLYDRRSGRTMTRQEAGLPPLNERGDTQRQREISDLVGQGVDRDRAIDLVDGREKVIQHPVSGQTMSYNKRTGETRPLDFPNTGPEQLPERGDDQGMLDEPLEVGFVPWLAEIGSKTGGQFTDALNNSELEQARTNLRMLREEFISALAKSGRPPVVEQQRILESFPSLGPMESPERAKASLQAVSDSLVKIRNDDLQFAQDSSAPADARGEARERARAIDRMLRRLDPSLFEEGDQGQRSTRTRGEQQGARNRGGVGDIENMGAQELNQLDPSQMSDQELEAAARRWEQIQND